MNTQKIQARLREINRRRNDDESAHAHEDELYRDVLQAIADGTCAEPAACAALALTSAEIGFSRWCA